MIKKTILIPFIVVSIIIIGIIGFVINSANNDEDEGQNPIIIVETEDCRVEEEIIIRVEQVKSGSNISWVIDENTTLFGETISVIFTNSDNHEVICIVDSDGKEIVRNTSISVMNQDYYVQYHGGIIINAQRGATRVGEGANIYPGITKPTVKIKMAVTDVIGTITYQVMFFDYEGPGDQLHHESHTGINEDFSFDMTFTEPVLPEIINECHIIGYIGLENGKVGSFNVEIWVTY